MFGPQNWRLNRNRCSFLYFCVVNIRYNHLQSIDTENLELLPNLCAVFPKRRVVEEAVPCRRIDINFEPSYDQLITGLAIGEEGEKIEGGRGWKRKRKHWPVLLFFVALATWRTRSASTKKKKETNSSQSVVLIYGRWRWPPIAARTGVKRCDSVLLMGYLMSLPGEKERPQRIGSGVRF